MTAAAAPHTVRFAVTYTHLQTALTMLELIDRSIGVGAM